MIVERGRNELKPLHGKPVQGVDMEGDLAQTLLILSKVIFWVKVWAMKKGALAILVTPVDKVGHVVSLMGGLEKVDGTDARWVVVRC